MSILSVSRAFGLGRRFSLVLAMALIVSCGMVSGCGADANIRSNTINADTTIGQELQDLKAAYDAEIISEREYNRARKDILKRYDD